MNCRTLTGTSFLLLSTTLFGGLSQVSDQLEQCCNQLDTIIKTENNLASGIDYLLSNTDQRCIITIPDLSTPGCDLESGFSPCDFKLIKAIPRTITAPGYYVVKKDLQYFPFGDTPAITIHASHVVLDFCSHSLSQVQDPDYAIADINGIQVEPCHTDIEIRNGTIFGFTGNGIFIDNNNSIIYIHDIITKYNGIRNNNAIASGTNAGIQLEGDPNDPIENVYIKDTQSYGNASGNRGVGLACRHTNQLKIENFIGNGNNLKISPDTSFGLRGFGIFLDNCRAVECIRCTTDRNGGSRIGSGIHAEDVSGLCCKECSSNFNRAGGTGAIAGEQSKAAGISLEDSDNFVLQQCCISNISNLSNVVEFGEDANGATGIALVRCTHGALDHCHVSNIHNPKGPVNFLHGFSALGSLDNDEESSDCKNILFKSCTALNIGNEFEDCAAVIGFSTFREDITDNATLDLVFDSCLVEGVSGGSLIITVGDNEEEVGRNAGIWLFDSLRSMIVNCVVKQVVTSEDISFGGAAIMVDGPVPEDEDPPHNTKNLLIENIMHDNPNSFGILDTGFTTHTAAMNNYAYHNGFNYDGGLPFNTKIHFWEVGTDTLEPADQTTPSFDNFDIFQEIEEP